MQPPKLTNKRFFKQSSLQVPDKASDDQDSRRNSGIASKGDLPGPPFANSKDFGSMNSKLELHSFSTAYSSQVNIVGRVYNVCPFCIESMIGNLPIK